MQFCNPAAKFSMKLQKVNDILCGNLLTKSSSTKVESSFYNIAENFSVRIQRFITLCQKKVGNSIIFPGQTSPKHSPGHVKCSCENPAEKLLLRVRKYFAQIPTKSRFSLTKSSQKMQWARRVQFWQLCCKIFHWNLEILLNLQKLQTFQLEQKF